MFRPCLDIFNLASILVQFLLVDMLCTALLLSYSCIRGFFFKKKLSCLITCFLLRFMPTDLILLICVTSPLSVGGQLFIYAFMYLVQIHVYACTLFGDDLLYLILLPRQCQRDVQS